MAQKYTIAMEDNNSRFPIADTSRPVRMNNTAQWVALLFVLCAIGIGIWVYSSGNRRSVSFQSVPDTASVYTMAKQLVKKEVPQVVSFRPSYKDLIRQQDHYIVVSTMQLKEGGSIIEKNWQATVRYYGGPYDTPDAWRLNDIQIY
jgi:hypothetical protein